MIAARKPDLSDDAGHPAIGRTLVHAQELPTVDSSFAITWLIVNDADSCRAGNSARVCSMRATYAWAGIIRKTWSSTQSQYVFDVMSAR